MYIKRILLLIVALGLVFMASFSFYVYKVMFKSNTSFEKDSVFIYIKTGTTYDELLFDMKLHLKNIDDFDVLAKRKKYFVKPGKYIIKKDMNNNDIVNSIRSNNITVNVIFNNIKNLNDLAGKVSNQIEADSLSFLNSFDSEFFSNKGFNKENILSMYIPNSYNFFWNTSAERFNERMFEEYTRFWGDNNRVEKANKLKLSKKEVIILASIVNEESKENSELPRIAG